MSFMNSEELLDLLIEEKLLTEQQKDTVLEEREKRRHSLMRTVGGRRKNDKRKLQRDEPDLVDVIASLRFKIQGKKNTILSEETIVRAVSFRKK